jgi:hypothetical protein
MIPRHFLIIAAPLMAAASLSADEVRYYQENGVTYQETRRVVQRQVAETQVQSCPRTVFREQVTSEVRDQVRSCWCPVTECRCETRWVGCWNPFMEPYPVSRAVPTTRWELRSEVAKVPVTTRQLVPETQYVQVPVTTYRTVAEEVVSRVPIAGPTMAVAAAPPLMPAVPYVAAGQPTLARRDQYGGISRLGQSDLPRYGGDAGWRPADMR